MSFLGRENRNRSLRKDQSVVAGQFGLRAWFDYISFVYFVVDALFLRQNLLKRTKIPNFLKKLTINVKIGGKLKRINIFDRRQPHYCLGRCSAIE